MKNLIYLILPLAILSGCKKNDESNALTNNKMRIENKTGIQIDSASIKIGNDKHSYGKLNPHEVSEYKSFSQTGYPTVKIVIAKKPVTFTIFSFEAPPIGNIKETPKPMTCVIIPNANSSAGYDLYFRE